MSTEKFSTETIEDLLKDKQDIQPPSELLGKLVEDMPPEIELHPEISGSIRRRAPLYRRPWALAAAAVVGVAITGSLSWEVYQHSLPDLKQSIVAEKTTAPSVAEEKYEHLQQAEDSLGTSLSETEEPTREGGGASVQGAQKAKGIDESPSGLMPQKPAPAEESQDGDLLQRRIRVVDPEGILIPGATVLVESREHDTVGSGTTSGDGTITIRLPKDGNFKARVSLPGFKERQVELPKGSSETEVQLSPEAFVGETITMEASSPLVDTRGIPAKSIPAPRTKKTQRPWKDRLREEKVSEVPAQRKSGLIPHADHPAPAPPSTGGETEPNAQPYGDVFFSSEGVNPFVDTEDDSLSTFGLDVDTASYSVARRYLEDGNLPPPEAIRVEEFLNSFDYGDAPPRRGDFRLILEGAPSVYAPGKGYETLRVALKAREVREDQRPPAVLVFCIDVSGSMARENRLGLVKRALRLLLDHLRSDDRVGLVIYGTTGRVLLEPTRDHEAIDRAIARLRSGGSTNAEEGLVLAYRLLDEVSDGEDDGRIRRVILCSDGVANVGRTGADQILTRIRREKNRGIELSTVGFGMGNYNDVLMERLADAGDGRYAYVDSIEEARKIFVEELTGNLLTIARDAKAQMEFDPDVVSRWRLIGYENRDIEDARFRDPTVDAGEIGAGHSVTALYQIKLRPGAGRRDVAAIFRLRYRPRNSERPVELEEKLRVGNLSRSWKKASPALQLSSQVAAFAEVLRHSYWSRGLDFEDILDHLDRIRRPPCDSSQMRELEDLVSRAARLQSRKKNRREE